MLYMLAYASFAVREFSLDELEMMLKDFKVKNQRLGVTGLLVCERGIFCQFLEGEEAKVMELYGEIRADTRHRHPHVHLRMPIQERAFKDWAIAMKGLKSVENCDPTELPLQYRAVIRRVFSSIAPRGGRPV
jgi:hypothetical protein